MTNARFLWLLAISCCAADFALAQTPADTAPQASAAASAPAKPGVTPAQDLDAEVKTFNDKVRRFHVGFTSLAGNILAIYAQPDEAIKWAEKVNMVKSAGDDKLQTEALKKAVPMLATELQKLISDPEFVSKTQQLGPEGLKQLRGSTMNFLILTMQARAILDSGKKLSGMADANPENLPKVLPVKESLPLLASSVETLMSSMSRISAAVKSSNPPPEIKSPSN